MGNTEIHEYTTEGYTVCFKVNNEIFICNPKPFMVSNFFATLLRNCRGTMLEPISLDGVTVEEISVFASYLHETTNEWDGNLQQWETIRRLSTLWGFEDIRKLALTKLRGNVQSEAGSSTGTNAGPGTQNPFKDIHEKMGEGLAGMGEEPINGIANILGGIGKGLGTGVGGVVLLPFAIASLPFIGIHKGIQWASKGKEKEEADNRD
ncbi:hypothetical protein FRB94_002661 [Tulasnella sp. JGI-2019a]|nr:hypothetical protein FRB94_002661 [Tulasnella sp. JGI-2019a]